MAAWRRLTGSLLGLVRRRTVGSLGHSLRGLRYVVQREEAVRVEFGLLVVLIPAALWWGEGAIEQLLLIASAVLVLLVELLNTAVELTLDRLSRSSHPLTGAAKDVGSAAVLVAMILFLMAWILLLTN